MKDISLEKIKNYLQGTLRYKIYNSILKKVLIRKHILSQIEFRIKVMKKECYSNGSCVKCGCNTPALQMCNKECEGRCYPPMMNKKLWDLFITGNFNYKGYVIKEHKFKNSRRFPQYQYKMALFTHPNKYRAI